METDDQLEYYFDEDDLEDVYFLEEEVSTSELLSRCTVGTLSSVRYNLILTVSFALLQRIVLSFRCFPYSIRHLLVAALGCGLLYFWDIPPTVSLAFLSVILFFIVFIFIPPRKHLGWIVALATFAALVVLEMTLESDQFTYRGILMIFAMKITSLSFDLSKNKYAITIPEIFGYLLNPSSLLFGPALPFTNYRIAFIPQSIYSSLLSLFPSLLYLLLSLLSLLVSSCFTQLLFSQEGLGRQFADAQSFRFSHYFICFWAQGLLSLGGGDSPLLVHPHQIELPRSLTQIVSLWNVPMHQYLFHYVYSRLRSLGTGAAIMGTFFVSSLLHGLNGQLSLVLLSLGLLSFTEQSLRSRLSSLLSSCCRARPCLTCTHTYTPDSSRTRLINTLFALLAIYHLVYLGMPWTGTMASYPVQHTLEIWSQHYYASHVIALLYFLLSRIL